MSDQTTLGVQTVRAEGRPGPVNSDPQTASYLEMSGDIVEDSNVGGALTYFNAEYKSSGGTDHHVHKVKARIHSLVLDAPNNQATGLISAQLSDDSDNEGDVVVKAALLVDLERSGPAS